MEHLERVVAEWSQDDRARALLYAYSRPLGPYRIAPRIVSVANPSAGADFSIPVAGQLTNNVVWVPLVLNALLTTSSTVANRATRLTLAYQDTTMQVAPVAANVTASSVGYQVWQRDGGIGNNFNAIANIMPKLPMPPGSTLAASTNNIQTGDQWSLINLYVLEIQQLPPAVLEEEAAELLAGSPKFETAPGSWLSL